MTSTGHAHLDRQRYDMAYRWQSSLANGRRTSQKFGNGFLYGAYSPGEWFWNL